MKETNVDEHGMTLDQLLAKKSRLGEVCEQLRIKKLLFDYAAALSPSDPLAADIVLRCMDLIDGKEAQREQP